MACSKSVSKTRRGAYIKLIYTKMTDKEFEEWAQASEIEYAFGQVKSYGMTQSAADKLSIGSLNKILPDGLNTQDQFFYSIRKLNEERVGFVWFSIKGEGDDRLGYVCHIVLDQKQRGKGYGELIMNSIEDQMKEQGAKRITLNVFAYNERAINLYNKLGYKKSEIFMTKILNDN